MNCLPTKYLNPANLSGSLEKKEKKIYWKPNVVSHSLENKYFT